MIYNKKLGYKITYFLIGFTNRYIETTYSGNYFFAEDTAGLLPKQIKEILKARDEVYSDSRMFFIRSLWANELLKKDDKHLLQNPFYVYKKDSTATRLYVEDELPLSYKDLVVTHDNQKFITLKEKLLVTNQENRNNVLFSYIVPSVVNKEVLIDANGFCDQGILWGGEMGLQRVSQLLPFEFQPSYKHLTGPDKTKVE